MKKIYINADGGTWIKSGMKRIAGITYVLDEFHLEKYLTKLTSHMKDSKEDAKAELRNAIRNKNKKNFEEIVQRLEDCLENEIGMKRIEDAKEYILSNWTAAKLRAYELNNGDMLALVRYQKHAIPKSAQKENWACFVYPKEVY